MKHRFPEAPGEKLTDAERARLRERLARHMATNPIQPVATPMRVTARSQWQRSFYFMRAGAFAAIVLVLGSGISYAAESALPGDFLYAVKRAVNEPVEGALAVSTKAKVSWNTELAQRRLTEAETLASRGKLDMAVATRLSSDAEGSAQAAAKQIAVLGESNPDDAAVAAVKLTASLSAHGSILAKIDGSGGAEQVGAAFANAGQRSAATGTATLGVSAPTAALSASGSATTSSKASTTAGSEEEGKGRVRAFKQAALVARADIAAHLSEKKDSLSAEDLAKAQSLLVGIDGALATAASTTDVQIAAGLYRQVLEQAQSLAVTLNAAAELKLQLLNSGRSDFSNEQVEQSGSTSADTGTKNQGTESESSGDRQNGELQKILAPFLR